MTTPADVIWNLRDGEAVPQAWVDQLVTLLDAGARIRKTDRGWRIQDRTCAPFGGAFRPERVHLAATEAIRRGIAQELPPTQTGVVRLALVERDRRSHPDPPTPRTPSTAPGRCAIVGGMSTQRREIPVEAPPFDASRSDYPLGGAKTGPIWRAAWEYLRGEWKTYEPGDAIVGHVSERVPDAHPETIRQILRRAAVAGILESEIRLANKRNRAHYRIKR